MATWDDVRRLALALPETTESGLSWGVRGKSFARERPLREKDLADLGDAAPDGPILCVRTDGLAEIREEAWSTRAPKRLRASREP